MLFYIIGTTANPSIFYMSVVLLFSETLALTDKELMSREYYFQSIDERFSEGMRREKNLAKRLKELDLTDSKDVSTFME